MRLKILRSFGKVEIVAENMIDAVVAVSGSAPAYVFMFIEAMADAAVSEGMPRKQAYELPRRQFTEVQRWCSIRENIREN